MRIISLLFLILTCITILTTNSAWGYMINGDESRYYKNHNEYLTKNFKTSEFHCHCKNSSCIETVIDESLYVVLQFIRNFTGYPVIINSGYRCKLHNTSCGGANRSQHLLGKAADIVLVGVSAYEVQQFLIMHQDQLGITIGMYDNFTHIDVRDEPIIFDRRSK